MEYGLVIAALTRLWSALRNPEGIEWDVVEKLVFVMVVGMAVGYFGIDGVTIGDGLVTGLATSGVFTGFSYIGQKWFKPLAS